MSRKRTCQVLIICVLAAGTVCAYCPVFHCGFVNYDDPQYVTKNLVVRQGLSLAGLRWAFCTGSASNWHPLTWLSHMLDCQLFALNPGGHHATSLLFHVLNTLLLFNLLRRMTGALWRSAFVAALFAWHPLHVESVAWISERKDVLSTFFGLLSIWAYASYARAEGRMQNAEGGRQKAESRNQQPVSRFTFHVSRHPPPSFFYLLSLLLFACSLMSKPMLVTLPCLLLLLDYWPLQRFQLNTQHSTLRTILPLLREKLPFFALALASSIVTLVVQHRATSGLTVLPLWLRLENFLVAYGRYLGKTVWPTDLAVFYPYLRWRWWEICGAGLAVTLLSIIAVRLARRRPWLPVGWFWFLGSLVPVIGLVQVGIQSMADRYGYIPLVGLFIILTWTVAEWAGKDLRRRRFTALVVLPALTTCAALTFVQTRFWVSTQALFAHATVVSDNNFLAHNMLGFELAEQGKLDDALANFQVALRIDPNVPETHNNLAMVLLKQGRVSESLTQSTAALRLKANFPEARVNLGRALFLQGNYTQALDHLTRALPSLPDHPVAHADLGDVLARLDRWDEAIAHYSQALRLQPTAPVENGLAYALARRGNLPLAILHWQAALQLDPRLADAHFFLGHALAADNQPDQAITHFQQALRLQPDVSEARLKLAALLLGRQRTAEALQEYRELLRRSPDSFEPMNNLAWILATHPDRKLRDGAEAVRLAERAAVLAGSNSPSALDTLAAAYAEAGRFREAVGTIQKAVALAQAAGQTNSLAKFRARLSLYRAEKPWREPE
jgi:tetratricopeptide (TPR) repeat protein